MPCAGGAPWARPPAGIFMPLGGHPAMRVCLLILLRLAGRRHVAQAFLPNVT